jgi:hypothetical protein
VYQSVIAQRQGTGSSGVGFAFALATIKELLPDKNICLAEDRQSGAQYQVGLDKRGILAWPQTGDTWILDRSLGHWALRAKVTGTSAPVIGGTRNAMSASSQSLLDLLSGLGLVDDQTTAQTLPVGVWQVVGAAGVPATFASPWSNFNTASYQGARYMIGTDGFVVLEGLVKTSSAVTGPSPIFTLPTGFRPQLIQVKPSNRAGATMQQLEIAPDGTVRAANITAVTVSYMTLDCRFSTV